MMENIMDKKKIGKVVKVLNQFEVVVNFGSSDGVIENQRFIVFQEGDEIKDPDTGESLGKLEIVRGQGEARHVQERLTTLRSIEINDEPQYLKRPRLRSPFESVSEQLFQPKEEYVTEVVPVPAPFRSVKEGDLVRRM
jgi:hypothetical protein